VAAHITGEPCVHSRKPTSLWFPRCVAVT
jgi:hypothetical protein